MNRLTHIDALRGFALFGILLLHAYGSFGIPREFGAEILQLEKLNQIASQFIGFLIRNKAFAVFSIMFGFSFYLQTFRSTKNNGNFSHTYKKRLFILLVFGYIHSIYFRADILTKYALMGFLLLLFHKIKPKYILALAVLMLLQIPDIINLIRSLIYSNLQSTDYANAELWGKIYQVSMTGSFFELAKVNMGPAFIEVWKLNFTTGRILNILGYFLLGFYLGRSCLLNDLNSCKNQYYYMLGTSAISYILLRFVRNLAEDIPSGSEVVITLTNSIITGYMDFFMVGILISSILILYRISMIRTLLNIFIPYGRMSLTSYMVQSLIGVSVFYGYGLGLYERLGTFLNLVVATGIFLILLAFSHIWFRYFRYGPLEYLWRMISYGDWTLRLKKN